MPEHRPEVVIGSDTVGPTHRPPAYPTPAPRTVGETITQGEQVATQERKRLGLGHAPLADMAELIANQGIWAAAVSLPDAMSGLFLRHAAIGMAILVKPEPCSGASALLVCA